jgi:hypothetical protein
MNKLFWNTVKAAPLVFAASLLTANGVVAQNLSTNETLKQVESYQGQGNSDSPMSQVTNVNQLRDVSPTDWAYEALRSLVDRYGCIAGFPNQTYRGNQALSRYEFAAGLNSCLSQIERLIASSESVVREDIDTINRLTQEFEAELATLGGRVDNLESRTAFLEDHQFSTTTKLQGEAVFGIAQQFNENDEVGAPSGEYDNETVFQDRVRLQFNSSFTGEDTLITRLDASNASPFGGGLETGALTYQTGSDATNNVTIGWLAYYFPIGDKIDVYLPAAGALWQDFVPTVSPYLDSFTGATGSLSSFGESSPIYKIGLPSGGGIGINFTPVEFLTVSAGYFGGDSFNPDEDTDGGLFNEEYSVLGQATVKLFDEKLQLAATYSLGQFSDSTNSDANGIYDLGVGTQLARQPFGNGTEVAANSYGVAASYQLGDKVALNAFGVYTDADEAVGGASRGESEIWSYGLGVALPDLLKEGSLAGLIVGAEPYVGSSSTGASQDIPLHVEGFYKYQLNDNISLTPGVIFITSPNGESDDDDALIGVLRTTFTF